MELARTVEVLDLVGEPAAPADPIGQPAERQNSIERDRPRTLSFVDLAVALAFALSVGAAIWSLQRSMDARFFTIPAGNDVWFEGDVPTVADTVLHRWSDQSRNARHPLVPLLATDSAYVLRGAGLGDRSILALLSAAAGAVWVALFYVIARSLTAHRLDAIVFTLLVCSTSSAMFWLAVPETYSLGSLTLLVPLALCALDAGRRFGAGWYVAASAVSLSVTTTNWTCGIFTAAARWPWRRALQITANALSIVVVLWAVQRLIFPTAPFFFGYSNEQQFVLPAASGGLRPVMRVLFFHTIVMPEVAVIPEPKWGLAMSVQQSPLGSSGAWGVAATALWAALLVSTLFGLWTSGEHRRFRIVLAATIAGQVLLHLLYGEETFLYALHVAPLLILTAALAAGSTTWRRPILALALVLAFTAAVNNASQLGTALAFFSRTSCCATPGAV
jgi:hypothetical protein